MDWVVREGSTELPQDVVYNGRLLNFPQEPLQTLHYRKMMGGRRRESERGTKLKLEVQKIYTMAVPDLHCKGSNSSDSHGLLHSHA